MGVAPWRNDFLQGRGRGGGLEMADEVLGYGGGRRRVEDIPEGAFLFLRERRTIDVVVSIFVDALVQWSCSCPVEGFRF